MKGVNFVDIQDAGDPVELARHYYEQGADELCFLDITASHEDRKATYEIIKATAKQVFVPLTVGGGVNSVEDISKLLQSGADKVSINSGAVRNPDLIDEASKTFGAQCIVIAADVKKTEATPSGWEVFTKGGRKAEGIDALAWIQEAYNRGAGEILLTSMDRDGTKAGYDTELLEKVTKLVNIPIIASGGAGNLEHVIDAFKAGSDAALLASILHFGETSISEIKDEMKKAALPTR